MGWPLARVQSGSSFPGGASPCLCLWFSVLIVRLLFFQEGPAVAPTPPHLAPMVHTWPSRARTRPHLLQGFHPDLYFSDVLISGPIMNHGTSHNTLFRQLELLLCSDLRELDAGQPWVFSDVTKCMLIPSWHPEEAQTLTWLPHALAARSQGLTGTPRLLEWSGERTLPGRGA